MIETSTYNKSYSKRDNLKSIIEDVWITHTKSGYEVGIDLKTKVYEITSSGGSSGDEDEPPTECIYFDHGEYSSSVHWDVPKEYRNKCMNRFQDVSKKQVIIYYVIQDYILQKGTLIEDYRCPQVLLFQTLYALNIAKELL